MTKQGAGEKIVGNALRFSYSLSKKRTRPKIYPYELLHQGKLLPMNDLALLDTGNFNVIGKI
jgi:hypothetical protein